MFGEDVWNAIRRSLLHMDVVGELSKDGDSISVDWIDGTPAAVFELLSCQCKKMCSNDHISACMRDVLHWLPLRQRIEFRATVLVWYSLIGQAPAYLTDLCRPSLSARSTRHLRSAEQGLLHVPFARTSTMQSQASSVVGPLVWNGLPFALRSFHRVFSQKFLQQLKTTLFGRAGVGSASE